jgi:protein-disulfide isomerase
MLAGFLLAASSCLGQDNGQRQTGHRVTLLEFADFQCPFCSRQSPDLTKVRAEYADRVDFIFKNFPLPFHKQARMAHMAAMAAGKQGKFWEMHDLIFLHSGHLSPDDFEHYAAELGLNREKFKRSLADPTLSDAIDKDILEGKALGVSATPTFLVDGHKIVGKQTYAKLKQIIESELNADPWPAPDKIQVNVAGAPSLGAESAPVTVVEFADFQCPFCAHAVLPLHELLAANQGRVRFVFKNFPLDSPLDSHLAHMAAMAAGEQGKFWEMHDLIYLHQSAMKRDDLLKFATELNLDMTRFKKDLENPQLKAKIENDRTEGERLGISATPTFLVNGEPLGGFSGEQLQARIDQQLSFSELRDTDAASTSPPLDLSMGPEDAAVKIRWYVDLTSPLTAKSAVALQQFMAARHGNVRVEFKNFPLQNHGSAMLVHEFVLAAAAQGKFWPVESLLLADSNIKDRAELKALASQAHLQQDQLWADIDSHKFAPMISRDVAEGKRLGVSGSPTFLVGDRKLDGVNALAPLQ